MTCALLLAGEGWEGFGDDEGPQQEVETPLAGAESASRIEELSNSTEIETAGDNINAPETSTDKAESAITPSQAVPAAEEEDEDEGGWDGLDADLVPGDSAVPEATPPEAIKPETVPEVEAGDVTVPEVEPSKEEEGGWEGLDEDLILPATEELQPIEDTQAAERTQPKEEAQAADIQIAESSHAAMPADVKVQQGVCALHSTLCVETVLLYLHTLILCRPYAAANLAKAHVLLETLHSQHAALALHKQCR